MGDDVSQQSGWYPDPRDPTLVRWRDHIGWTPNTRPAIHPDTTPGRPTSAQALLAGMTYLPPGRATTAVLVRPGWYPDPVRFQALRFFDGKHWTARTRSSAAPRSGWLPRPALALRARMLTAADASAVRDRDKPRTHNLTIPRSAYAANLTAGARARTGNFLGTLATFVAIAGVAGMLLVGWNLWGSNLYTAARQSALAGELTDSAPVWEPMPAAPAATLTPADAPAPQLLIDGSQPADASPVGTIRIDKIGLDMTFVYGTDAEQLQLGPGLWKWGVLPGTPGNATISGHRTTYGHPFRRLDELTAGDRIVVSIPGRTDAVYEVRGTTIASPFDVAVTQQTAGVRLTLTTCNPVGSATERLVVEAELVEGDMAPYAVPADSWQLLQ